MQEHNDQNGNIPSPAEEKKLGEWTKKDMEEAQPLPMPEIDAEDDD